MTVIKKILSRFEGATAKTTPVDADGVPLYDSADVKMPKFLSWANIKAALMANPMTTAGDIIVGGTAGAPTRFAKGTALQVLRMNSDASAQEYATLAVGAAPLFACRETDFTTQSTTYVDVTDMAKALEANSSYLFFAYLLIATGTNTQYARAQFTLPTGATSFIAGVEMYNTNSFYPRSTTLAALTPSNSSADYPEICQLSGKITLSSTAGNIQLRLKQDSGGNALILKGSNFLLMKLP